EIIVSPEDDIELKRIHITNRSRKQRNVELTSYAEVVLAEQNADIAHPAFSNLFVQTEIQNNRKAILCTRRPRSDNEKNPWMFHLVNARGKDLQEVEYETDRNKFIGRGNSIHRPAAMEPGARLSNTSGSVLDPVISIRARLVVESMETIIVDFINGIAETKEGCSLLVDKYQDRNIANRGLELSWTHSQVILRQLNASEAEAQLYNRLAAPLIYSNASTRTEPSVILKNNRGQSGLWAYAISGDLPIVLVQIEDSTNIDLVKQLVKAHAYWRLKGLVVDLVVFNEDPGGYRQELQDRLHSLVAPGVSANLKDQPGGIFIKSSDQVNNEDRILFQTVAHIVLSDRQGTLEEQLNKRMNIKTSIPAFSPTKFYTSQQPVEEVSAQMPKTVQLYNGYGGFSENGNEYIIITRPGKPTPAPWINVLGNPQFGTIVSESGQSYTWVENAHSLRLTPWNNDPVTDLRGEAMYIRDEESGKFWSPVALPCVSLGSYVTHHGFGFSKFKHIEDGIQSEYTVFIDKEAPVKFMVLNIKNTSGRTRKLTLTGYVEWVLGDNRAKNLMHTITEIDSRSGAVLARNAYNSDFHDRVAFFDVDDLTRTFTTDRTEFIGRNGTLAHPEAMERARLSGKTGAALDPCAALQVNITLEEEETKEIVFRLGAGKDYGDAQALIQKFEGREAALKSFEGVKAFWKEALTAVQINTGVPALDILTNGWLNYQALACRLWARSGFYQSGGAFGFRDQLQDVLSLVHTKPEFFRAQILLCASRQFREGDVQHWWHPPAGRGVRTTCSDDYLWLPYATARYVETTGDYSVLEEEVHFLEGRLLNSGEESYYDLPIRSDRTANLYEHCRRAIEHGLRFGVHGLPLMGSGDWNDGMDKVGEHGKGESVWLAFFLYTVLDKFQLVAERKKDKEFENKCISEAATLKDNISKNGWDGDWYRRAYFDDGRPLGSSENPECKIDSIAQSWSVISGAGEEGRMGKALHSAEENLVKRQNGLIQLFDPPFDKSDMNPGYIKGYVPGVRENGGQYTHAAIWLIMSFAERKNKSLTWELLQMINPVNKSRTQSQADIYKVEPYVIAADVYAESLHKGRGGWTWYTGSAGWMYQLIIEWVFGLKRRGERLYFTPCIPEEWEKPSIHYRYKNAMYKFTIIQKHNEKPGYVVDGKYESADGINLVEDGQEHEVIFYT
ncbi:MAG: cyclic beta 1-2 glucan synthetase, partial [Ferruginibacter sp.]